MKASQSTNSRVRRGVSPQTPDNLAVLSTRSTACCRPNYIHQRHCQCQHQYQGQSSVGWLVVEIKPALLFAELPSKNWYPAIETATTSAFFVPPSLPGLGCGCLPHRHRDRHPHRLSGTQPEVHTTTTNSGNQHNQRTTTTTKRKKEKGQRESREQKFSEGSPTFVVGDGTQPAPSSTTPILILFRIPKSQQSRKLALGIGTIKS